MRKEPTHCDGPVTCRPLVLQQQRASHPPARNNLDTKHWQCHRTMKRWRGLSLKTAQSEAHLAQGTFKLPQKIIITQIIGVIVNVIHAKLQLLHHLEIVVDDKLLGELWIQAVQDHLCAPKLIHKEKTDI